MSRILIATAFIFLAVACHATDYTGAYALFIFSPSIGFFSVLSIFFYWAWAETEDGWSKIWGTICVATIAVTALAAIGFIVDYSGIRHTVDPYEAPPGRFAELMPAIAIAAAGAFAGILVSGGLYIVSRIAGRLSETSQPQSVRPMRGPLGRKKAGPEKGGSRPLSDEQDPK